MYLEFIAKEALEEYLDDGRLIPAGDKYELTVEAQYGQPGKLFCSLGYNRVVVVSDYIEIEEFSRFSMVRAVKAWIVENDENRLTAMAWVKALDAENKLMKDSIKK